MKERPLAAFACDGPKQRPFRETRRNVPNYRFNRRACRRLLNSFVQSKWLLLLIATLSLLEVSRAFNLSPEAAMIFEDPQASDDPEARQSYFGYSVGLRSRKRYSDNWLLVGAPRANLTPTPITPVGLVEPGALYKCPVGLGGGGCTQLLMDNTGNTEGNLWSGELGYHDLKNHGWLGGTMDTQDSDREATMVCAPQWKNQLYRNTYLMNGACYDQDSELRDATAQKRLPLTQFSQQNYQVRGSHTVFHYAHGELGMSLHFPEQEDTVLLGAPGVFNWQGTIIELRDAVLGPGSISRRRRQEPEPGVRAQNRFSIEFIPNPYFTSSISDADYFGYSVSSGTFVPGQTHYVGGAPRGANSKGKVLVFQMGQSEESELQILVERTGDQVGEYFGAAVTATDLNNDGLADLLVGAPLHSTPVSPDHGAIYYFSNNGAGQLALHGVKIEGTVAPGARFGSTLAAPGDLNKDGYNDIVVGAPYEGPGVVYVYLGSVDGLRQQFSQRISAEDFESTGRPLAGFGVSISRGVDVDDNQYPDIAVGSYVSGHAVLLRTRPVAVLGGSTTTTPTRLTLFDNSFVVTACVTYQGIGVPQIQNVTVKVSLDHQRQLVAPRAFFEESNTAQFSYNVTLQRDGRQCRQLNAKVQPERNNAPDPVGIRLQYWLTDPSLQPSETARPARQFLAPDAPSPHLGPITSPVTDPSESRGRTSFLSFVTGCEEDGDPSCSSDMRIRAWWPSQPNRLVVGKHKRIKMAVAIENHGEPAFLPNVTFSVQRPLDLLLPTSHSCERLGTDNPSIMCRLENPLLMGKQENLEVEVDVEQLGDSSSPVEVQVVAGSSDIELTPTDNSMSAALPLAAEAQLTLHGSSTEEQVTYPRMSTSVINTTVVHTLSFVHRLTIVKRGSTPLGEVALQVEIPVKDAANNTLLTIHAPEREFQGELFPCLLEGARWFSAKGGAGVNFTDAGDSALGLTGASSGSGQSRNRRQATSASSDPVDTHEEQEYVPLVSCRALPALQCAVMRCRIGSWPHDSASASIAYRLNLNLTTLGHVIGVKDGTSIASEATATIRSLASSIFFEGEKSTRGVARTTVLPGRLAGEGVPWWWYLLAVLLGLLLLAALIYGLYKLGFFKRKEKEEMDAMTATLTTAENDYGANRD